MKEKKKKSDCCLDQEKEFPPLRLLSVGKEDYALVGKFNDSSTTELTETTETETEVMSLFDDDELGSPSTTTTTTTSSSPTMPSSPRPCLRRDVTKQRFRKYPMLGVLKLDYKYPANPGDMDSPDSFGYPVVYREVPGLTFEVCQSGKFTKQVAYEFDQAVKYLVEDKKVSAISGDCGFMMWFQRRIRKLTTIPVVLSALAQVPSISTAFGGGTTIIVLTANANSLKPMTSLIKSTCGGTDIRDKRIHLEGCQDVPHFGYEVANGLKVDTAKALPGIVERATAAVRDCPKACAILMECTELPPYSDAVRQKTGLPVFDAITNCDFVMHSYLDNPNFGGGSGDNNNNNGGWLLEWDGVQEPNVFGKSLRPSARLRLLTRMSYAIYPETGKSIVARRANHQDQGSSTCDNDDDDQDGNTGTGTTVDDDIKHLMMSLERCSLRHLLFEE